MKPASMMVCLIFTLQVISAAMHAQEQLNIAEIDGYNKVIRLEQVKYDGNIREPVANYLKTYAAFLDVLLEGTPDAIDNFENQAQGAAEAIPEIDAPLYAFIGAELGLQKAFVKLKTGNELAAVWQLRQTYREVESLVDQFPGYIPFRRTWGLLQILVGAIPDNYQWLPRLLGVSGSIEDGQQLLASIPEEHWLYSESRVIIYLTDSYLLEKPDLAVSGFKELLNERHSNPLFSYLYMTVLMRDHHAASAIEHFRKQQTPIHLTYYLAGNAYLQAARYEEATQWLKAFEDEYAGQDFRKDTAFKLFLANYLSGDMTEATHQFERIREVGGDATESDRYAARSYSKGMPNPDIMRIRLATDGGFYDRAQELCDGLSTSDFISEEEKVEFIYRKARLFHFTHQYNEAIQAYQQTIAMQGRNRWYFAPNSCLQLGYIHLDMKKMEAAQEYFRKTFDYRGYEYKKGIDRKAHSALVTYF